MIKKKSHLPWIPAVFCTFLSLMALMAAVISHLLVGMIPFLSFLPMCFFFVGSYTSLMQNEIDDLRREVDVLKGIPVAAPRE